PSQFSTHSLHAALPISVVQCGDEILRYAAQPEPACSDRHVVVEQAGKRSRGVGIDFAHVERDLTTDCTKGTKEFRQPCDLPNNEDRKSTRLNSSHVSIS